MASVRAFSVLEMTIFEAAFEVLQRFQMHFVFLQLGSQSAVSKIIKVTFRHFHYTTWP